MEKILNNSRAEVIQLELNDFADEILKVKPDLNIENIRMGFILTKFAEMQDKIAKLEETIKNYGK